MKAKDLTDKQQEIFAELFYESPDAPNDGPSPCPWGCPWMFGTSIELYGDTIEEMVAAYIKEYRAEWEAIGAEEEVLRREIEEETQEWISDAENKHG